MSMHGSYDEYGQDNDTADLVRSVALSSAKLWEEVFERLRRLEEAQVELRAMLGRIEGQLPAGPVNAALGTGAGTAPSWPDRVLEAPAGGYDSAQTDLFVPDPEGDVAGSVGHVPRDAIDLLVGTGPPPATPGAPEDEPATFFFPPAAEAAVSPSDDAGTDLGTGWPGSDLLGTPGWTSPHTIRYDEGFTSRDVVGPPTEEVQAVDMTLPERSNAEYFGRHAAGPPPGFAVANGDVPPSGFEAFESEIPQAQVPQVAPVEPPFDPEIDQQLQQAAQAVEMEAATGAGPGSVPPPPFGFAAGAPGIDQAATGFETWSDDPGALQVPLVFAPGDEPPAARTRGQFAPPPPPPPGFAGGPDSAPPPPPGFASGSDLSSPAPPPGFASGHDAAAPPPPPPPGFGSMGDVLSPPPPPPGFGSMGDAPPQPPPGFGSPTDIAPPPPPSGFAGGFDPVPPPPPGFAGGPNGTAAPAPPPPGFGSTGDVPPPPPPGFTGGPAGAAPPPPPPGFGMPGAIDDVVPPPPGFALGTDLTAFDDLAGGPPPPPPGFAAEQEAGVLGSAATSMTPPPPPGFSTASSPSPAAAAPPPPPPPGFAPGAEVSQSASPRTPNVTGSIADDVLAISSITPPAEAEPADVASVGGGNGNGNGHGNGHGNGNGNGHGNGTAEDGPPPPITPDFFARAGRRRR